MDNRPVVWRISAILAAWAALFLVSMPAVPKFQVCLFHWLTGRPCPLCGMTRAMFALAKGEWSQAIGFHPLSPVAAVMLISMAWPGRWRAPLWVAGLASIALYGAWRAVLA